MDPADTHISLGCSRRIGGQAADQTPALFKWGQSLCVQITIDWFHSSSPDFTEKKIYVHEHIFISTRFIIF